MRVYIRNQEGSALIEKGKILSIGGSNKRYLVTGEDELMTMSVGKYKDEARAKEVLEEVMARVISPTVSEVQKGIIFIDLKGTE